MLEEIVSRAEGRYPDLSIDSVLRPGSGGKVLIEASHDAALVVVGARGHGGFGGLSIGSVAAQTAAHAAAPVMVIRPTDDGGDERADTTEPTITVPHPGPVIVGIDGSPHQDGTLEYGFRAAAIRDVPLVAVNVWWQLPKHNLGPDVPGRYNMAEAQDEARRLLAEMTAGWSSQFPDVPLEQRPMQSMNPSYSLIQASQTAGLVVVGSRGRGGLHRPAARLRRPGPHRARAFAGRRRAPGHVRTTMISVVASQATTTSWTSRTVRQGAAGPDATTARVRRSAGPRRGAQAAERSTAAAWPPAR